MTDRERAAYFRGIRNSVEWLHARAREMNDPHAKAILNTAAFQLGQHKPHDLQRSAEAQSERASRQASASAESAADE